MMIQNGYTSIYYILPLLNKVLSLIRLPVWTIRVNHISLEPNFRDNTLALRGHDMDKCINLKLKRFN
jgi:hypothetical protein